MAEWNFIGARRYECSVCGEGIVDMPCDWNNGEPLYNFCPYCGANMNMKKADGDENKCHRHGIRLEDGTPIYECIGCGEQDCEEDCISREYILGEAFMSGEYNRETKSYDLPVVTVSDIENAPSVVPSRAEGEWLPIIEGNELGEAYQAGIYCSECGETLGCEANYCPNCGAKMKGADDE